MLPNLERDVLLGVEKVVHHFVVDLQIAHGDHALGRVGRQPLPSPKINVAVQAHTGRCFISGPSAWGSSNGAKLKMKALELCYC